MQKKTPSKTTPRAPSAPPSDAALGTDVRLVFYSILLFALALQLVTLFVRHAEFDELIYLTLANKVSRNFFDYTLQGSELLAKLPKATYDQPLFLRPPLFVYLLSFFGIFGAQLLLPVAAGLCSIAATYVIGKKLGLGNNRALLACLILAFCPILLFTSVRILIDTVLTLLIALAVLTTLAAVNQAKLSLFVAAGAVVGCALLTKETAILVAPVLVYLIFKGGITRQSFISLAYLGATAALIAAPWFIYHHAATGVFFRGTELNDENRNLPFIKMMLDRSWYYYVAHTVFVAPVYLFGYYEMAQRLRRRGDLTELIWALSFMIPLTIFGYLGNGYQTRYILPAMPALALLAASALHGRSGWLSLTAAALLAYQLLTGVLNAAVFRLADVFTPIRFFIELMP